MGEGNKRIKITLLFDDIEINEKFSRFYNDLPLVNRETLFSELYYSLIL